MRVSTIPRLMTSLVSHSKDSTTSHRQDNKRQPFIVNIYFSN
nr:MAG TPA: hypothetical protein [Caudoviricetes sp.]